MSGGHPTPRLNAAVHFANPFMNFPESGTNTIYFPIAQEVFSCLFFQIAAFSHNTGYNSFS